MAGACVDQAPSELKTSELFLSYLLEAARWGGKLKRVQPEKRAPSASAGAAALPPTQPCCSKAVAAVRTPRSRRATLPLAVRGLRRIGGGARTRAQRHLNRIAQLALT